MNSVVMNDFGREGEELIRAELAACERVFRSGWWILGREVTAFEQAWAGFLGTPAAIGCANGLDAIELGLRALGIGPGDEVITTPMTAFATALRRRMRRQAAGNLPWMRAGSMPAGA